MGKVGVRELKTHASAIVRRVREDGETIDLTYRGEVVARIVPTQPRRDPESIVQIWNERRQLIDDIAKHRSDSVSAEETIREIRREL